MKRSAALALIGSLSADTAGAAGYYPPTPEALGPWYGTGAPVFGAPGCGGAVTMAEEFSCQVDRLAASDIPFSVFLFDGSAWSAASTVDGSSCRGESCCNWLLGDAVIRRLEELDVRALLHFWGGCQTPEQYQRAYDRLGNRLLGFYLDEGSTDAEAAQVIDYLQSVLPGDSECVLKAYAFQGGQSDAALRDFGNVCYVNDLDANFEGFAEGVRRVFSKSHLLAAPYNEFTSYDPEGLPAEDEYVRRLHWGALQPVMAQTPWRNADPWRPEYTSRLMDHYRYYSWLHHELTPYLYSYVYNMHERPAEPVFRDADAERFTTRLGEELFVAYVTRETDTLDVIFPSGTWIDYRNAEVTYQGGTLATLEVPLGREPIFVREGALVPLRVERDLAGHGTAASRDSLTMLVYPQGSSSFHYREHASQRWLTFTSTLSPASLVLEASEHPRQPILYRIERQSAPPAAVMADGPRLTLAFAELPLGPNRSIERLASEELVTASTNSAWTYDPSARRVIVKLFAAEPGVTSSDGCALRPPRSATNASVVALLGLASALASRRPWRKPRLAWSRSA